MSHIWRGQRVKNAAEQGTDLCVRVINKGGDSVVSKSVLCYTRLPGQDTTVSVTLFFCSLSMGMSDELFIPTVVAPFTATISSPHLQRTTDH